MKHKHDFSCDGDYYAVHEYYDLEDEPAWTESPVMVDGCSIEDVKKSLMLMLQDIDKHGVKDYDADKG
jgi:hypothetical protein